MSRYIQPLLDAGLVAQTEASARSPRQRYVTTQKGLEALERT